MTENNSIPTNPIDDTQLPSSTMHTFPTKPSRRTHRMPGAFRWFKRLPYSQKMSLAALTLIVMIIPLGVVAVKTQVRNWSKAYSPITPPEVLEEGKCYQPECEYSETERTTLCRMTPSACEPSSCVAEGKTVDLNQAPLPCCEGLVLRTVKDSGPTNLTVDTEKVSLGGPLTCVKPTPPCTPEGENIDLSHPPYPCCEGLVEDKSGNSFVANTLTSAFQVVGIQQGIGGKCVKPSSSPTPTSIPIISPTSRTIDSQCTVTGCNGEVCTTKEQAAMMGNTSCEWKPEYAQFKSMSCKYQSAGKCGWSAPIVYPTPMPSSSTPIKCVTAGCNGNLCVEAEEAKGIITTCEIGQNNSKPYGMTCKQQSDGKCGWSRPAASFTPVSQTPPQIQLFTTPSSNASGSVTLKQGQAISFIASVKNLPGKLNVDYSRKFYLDTIFDGNCTIADWTVTCTAKTAGVGIVHLEIQKNNTMYVSNLIHVFVTPTPTPTPAPIKCVTAGCNGNLCLSEAEAKDTFTTCEIGQNNTRPAEMICKQQSDGKCGWSRPMSSPIASCIPAGTTVTKTNESLPCCAGSYKQGLIDSSTSTTTYTCAAVNVTPACAAEGQKEVIVDGKQPILCCDGLIPAYNTPDKTYLDSKGNQVRQIVGFDQNEVVKYPCTKPVSTCIGEGQNKILHYQFANIPCCPGLIEEQSTTTQLKGAGPKCVRPTPTPTPTPAPCIGENQTKLTIGQQYCCQGLIEELPKQTVPENYPPESLSKCIKPPTCVREGQSVSDKGSIPTPSCCAGLTKQSNMIGDDIYMGFTCVKPVPTPIPTCVVKCTNFICTVINSALCSQKPTPTPSPAPIKCITAGCNGNLCVPDDGRTWTTTCEIGQGNTRPAGMTCKQQPNGACGWSQPAPSFAPTPVPSTTPVCKIFSCSGILCKLISPIVCPPTPTPQPTPSPSPTPSCVTAGSQRHLCVSTEEVDDLVSTTDIRPEYACYTNAKCEMQPNQKCGWTPTDSFTSCMTGNHTELIWWYDDTHRSCDQRVVMGDYMYQTLRTFQTYEECQTSLQAEPVPTPHPTSEPRTITSGMIVGKGLDSAKINQNYYGQIYVVYTIKPSTYTPDTVKEALKPLQVTVTPLTTLPDGLRLECESLTNYFPINSNLRRTCSLEGTPTTLGDYSIKVKLTIKNSSTNTTSDSYGTFALSVVNAVAEISPSPTATASASPTTTPTESACVAEGQPIDLTTSTHPSCCDGLVVITGAANTTSCEKAIALASPTPTPAPTDKPSSNSSSSSPSSSSSSSSGSQQCQNQAPTSAADLYQIDTTRSTATLYFAPANRPYTHYVIQYGEGNDMQHSMSFSADNAQGALKAEIGALKANTTYSFHILAFNGCASGSWSNQVRAITTTSGGRTNYKNMFVAAKTTFSKVLGRITNTPSGPVTSITPATKVVPKNNTSVSPTTTTTPRPTSSVTTKPVSPTIPPTMNTNLTFFQKVIQSVVNVFIHD